MQPANQPPVTREQLVAAERAKQAAWSPICERDWYDTGYGEGFWYYAGDESNRDDDAHEVAVDVYNVALSAHRVLHDRALAHKAACERALREARAKLNAIPQGGSADRARNRAALDEAMEVVCDAADAFCAACDVLDGGLSDEKA